MLTHCSYLENSGHWHCQILWINPDFWGCTYPPLGEVQISYNIIIINYLREIFTLDLASEHQETIVLLCRVKWAKQQFIDPTQRETWRLTMLFSMNALQLSITTIINKLKPTDGNIFTINNATAGSTGEQNIIFIENTILFLGKYNSLLVLNWTISLLSTFLNQIQLTCLNRTTSQTQHINVVRVSTKINIADTSSTMITLWFIEKLVWMYGYSGIHNKSIIARHYKVDWEVY